ncbi:MAG: hypothetical protein LBT74_04755 [Acidobacteriota bacterium]|nr:hypothetical protein [Acidobacteriota bacterium]
MKLVKKFSTAVSLGLALMAFAGCSSTPEGTVPLGELAQGIEKQVGRTVVVVGTVDTGVPGMSAVKLFKLYKGTDYVWASFPEGGEEPPQSVKVRVTGVVAEQEFSGGVGKKVYVKSESVTME